MSTWRDIPGWFDWQNIYDEIVATSPPDSVVVEVGVCFGRSVAYLAEKIVESGKGGPGGMWCLAIDPWDITEFAPQDTEASALLAKHGTHVAAFEACMKGLPQSHWDVIIPWRGTSIGAALAATDRVAKLNPEREKEAWAVFIDGQHEYEHVLNDILAWRPLVRKGGWLAGHDHTDEFPGVKRAVLEVFGPGGFRVDGSSWVVRV